MTMQKSEKVTVVGCGAWGTTLAIHIAGLGNEVTLWCHDDATCKEIINAGENKLYLPGFKLPKNIRVVSKAQDAAEESVALIFATSSNFLRPTLRKFKPHITSKQRILNAVKGLEEREMKTMLDVYNEELTPQMAGAIAFLSGPNLAREIAEGLPAAAVVASSKIHVAQFFQRIMLSKTFRIYTNSDVIGVELGGTLKNVIAIAAGIIEGVGYGYNTRAGLLIRGVTEIARLGVAMGADVRTFFGLTGMGDLICTCSPLSRNYQVGVQIGKGRKLKDILKDMVAVAEGVSTCKVANRYAKKFHVEMPITAEIYKVLFQDKDPKKAIDELMLRKAKPE